jgi:hypothetical protein
MVTAVGSAGSANIGVTETSSEKTGTGSVQIAQSGPCRTITYTNTYGQLGDFLVSIDQGSTTLYSASPSVSPSGGIFTVDLSSIQPPIVQGTTYTLIVGTVGNTGIGAGAPFSNYQISLSPDLQFDDGTQSTTGYFQNPSALKLTFTVVSNCGQ